MRLRCNPAIPVFLLLFWAASAAAAVELSTETELGLGTGAAVLPSIGVLLGRDSNIYNTQNDEFSSLIGVVTPSLLLATRPASRRFAVLYQGDYAHFFDDSANDYDDHSLSGLGRLQFGSRGRLDIAATTARGHRGRGTDQTGGLDPDSPNFPSEPDEFDHQQWRAKFRYGADGNRGRLRFSVGGDRRKHTNNFVRTRPFDYATTTAGTGLSLQFHQRTAIVMDAVFTDIGFDAAAPSGISRDGKDWRLLLGVTWAATAKTVGSVRLGVQQRRFEDPAVTTANNPSWEIDIRWSPREYSHVDFVTSRINQEAFDDGAFIDSIVSELGWTHEWNQGFETVVQWTQSKFDFISAVRNQNINEVYLGLRVPRGRWLTWEAGYEWRSSASDLDLLSYDGNMFSIGVNVSR